MVFTAGPLLHRANIHLSTDCTSPRRCFFLLPHPHRGRSPSFTCIIRTSLVLPPNSVHRSSRPLFAVIARNHTRCHYESDLADAHFFLLFTNHFLSASLVVSHFVLRRSWIIIGLERFRLQTCRSVSLIHD